MDKRVLLLLFVLLLPFSAALEGFSSPQASVVLDNSLIVSDSVVFSSGFVSDDGVNWVPFSFTGRSRGNWIIGQATSDVRTDANYYAVYSCSWSDGWSCSDDWQVYDTTTQSVLVQSGQPRADIVVSADAPNMVQIAAEYFQNDIEAMSGATLPIRNAPGNDYDFHVYIGESQYTDDLGITDEGTEYDGYKIVSGNNYLVMLGDDKPYDIDAEMTEAEWDAHTAPDVFGNGQYSKRDYHRNFHVYDRDGRGSMNAIHDFLETQGMRYYYPTDFGTVTPTKNTITVPSINRLENPAFAMRSPYHWYKHFSHLDHAALHLADGSMGSGDDWFRFFMSMGLNAPKEVTLGGVAHGLNYVTNREETQLAHPEYYAVWGGERMNGQNGIEYKQNLCSPELKAATIRYASVMINTYGHMYPEAKYISVWPQDGFTRVSEHNQECRDMATPEYGNDGRISDYVWNFANDVAWGVYDEHGEGHYILGGAYSAYKLPPRNITNERGIAPNLAVMIAHNRVTTANPEQKAYREQLVSDWNEIAPGQVFMNDKYLYNRYGGSGQSVPYFFPQIISEDFKYLEGKANGEFDEVFTNLQNRDSGHDAYAATGLNMYVTSRLFWDPQLDVDVLLDEYYTVYYGPAADTMQELVEYSEANLANDLVANPEHLDRMRELGEQALNQVPENSVYAQRIQPLIGMMNANFVGEEVVVQECQVLNSPGTTYVMNQPVSSNDQCFLIDQNGITLDCRGFAIASEQAAVRVHGSDTNRGHYYTIKNCEISSTNGRGIQAGGVDYGVIENNNIYARQRGISIGNPKNMIIRDNYAYSPEGAGAYIAIGTTQGIDFRTDNVIENNVFESDSGSGVAFYNNDGDVIRNNEFISNSGPAIRMYNPENTLYENNIMRSITGRTFQLTNPSNFTQRGNTEVNE